MCTCNFSINPSIVTAFIIPATSHNIHTNNNKEPEVSVPTMNGHPIVPKRVPTFRQTKIGPVCSVHAIANSNHTCTTHTYTHVCTQCTIYTYFTRPWGSKVFNNSRTPREHGSDDGPMPPRPACVRASRNTFPLYYTYAKPFFLYEFSIQTKLFQYSLHFVHTKFRTDTHAPARTLTNPPRMPAGTIYVQLYYYIVRMHVHTQYMYRCMYWYAWCVW